MSERWRFCFIIWRWAEAAGAAPCQRQNEEFKLLLLFGEEEVSRSKDDFSTVEESFSTSVRYFFACFFSKTEMKEGAGRVIHFIWEYIRSFCEFSEFSSRAALIDVFSTSRGENLRSSFASTSIRSEFYHLSRCFSEGKQKKNCLKCWVKRTFLLLMFINSKFAF